MSFQQGQIVWAALPAPIGRRPVLVLTRDAAVNKLNRISVALCTRTIRGATTEVILEQSDGVPSRSVVSLDSIITLDRQLLSGRITMLGKQKMDEVFTAIRRAFDMP